MVQTLTSTPTGIRCTSSDVDLEDEKVLLVEESPIDLRILSDVSYVTYIYN